MPAVEENLEVPIDFTHLEVHSHYTLLGATPSVDDLVSRGLTDRLSYLSLTDSNVLYGAVVFDSACRAAGIRPIIGMTVSAASPASPRRPGKLTLLAMNPTGYVSLCGLSSLLQGRKDRERAIAQGLTWDTLAHFSEGLVCLSGGRQGWVSRLLAEGNQSGASQYISRLGGVYGENAFLSLEIHRPGNSELNKEIATLGQRFGLPLVAVQPVYYIEPADRARLRLLTAIDRNCSLASVNDAPADSHWLNPVELAQRFVDFPEAVENVAKITRRCGPVLPDGRPIFPVINSVSGASEMPSAEESLAHLAVEGVRAKYDSDPPHSVTNRLRRELSAITRTGFAPLFLIVADIVRFARSSDIPVSTRGSVANSLVAYSIGITTVDPIAHDLLFERFINPARINPPDIDLDFCSRRRDRVLEYVRDTYGSDKVALVAVVSTMQPKSAVRETAKALRLDDISADQLVKRLPSRWHPDPRRRDRETLLDLAEQLEDPKMKEVLRAANEIVGQPHHLSIHPGGVVITPGPLTDYVPLQWTPKGFMITQYDHRDLELIGLPKLDLLGIRALTVLADAADLVREHHDPSFLLADIDLRDPTTGDLLEKGKSIGVFQCESAGSQRTMRKLRARTVQDLAVANAFFKPGPATGGMAQAFVRRYRGEEEVEYLHPALEPILNSTQGVLLFQEQILRVATEIAGLSWQQADHLRRGMSKFKPEEMEALENDFVGGCQRPPPEGPAFTLEQSQTLWEQVRAFAGYGFNRGHATAYADVSYRSAYIKAHWPESFLCARLADRGGFHHPAIYMAEAVRLGIQINPPHVNYSGRKFTLIFDDLKDKNRTAESGTNFQTQPPHHPIFFMGLDQVRDLRKKSVNRLIFAREERPFSDLRDLLVRVSLQKKEILHLIRCGALDGLGDHRAALEEEAMLFLRAGTAQQTSFDFTRQVAEEETVNERLAWESFILGLPVSVHPLDTIDDLSPTLTPLSRLIDDDDPVESGTPVEVVGVRLPGWTGGPGFFLGDREAFVIVRQGKEENRGRNVPEVWQPLWVHGRWRRDEWGTSWLQAEQVEPI